ncbi:M24 family metallopeptidase [Bradyrhizobium sp. STM 3566]|uniref:M24 family metallopeptidase n=1 Tax=Bradyrhizobium sp. STM 3566 TaxID=578928 RepID=UPI00388F7B89
MAEVTIDVLLVTVPENIFYLSGYRTTGYYVAQCLVIPIAGDPYFVVRNMEFPNVKKLSWLKDGYPVPDIANYGDELASRIRDITEKGSRIGFEEQGFFLPPALLATIRNSLVDRKLVPTSGIVEQARRIKSLQELAYMSMAAKAADAGMEAGVEAIVAGRTENHVAGVAYLGMMLAGGEYPSSSPYVVAGPRSALGHSTSERGVIKRGDVVYLEVGGCWFRYGAAIIRTVSVGRPASELQKAADTALGALNAMLDFAKPGVSSGAVDAVGRGIVERAGLAKFWPHRAGYSIGIGFPPGWGEGHIIDLKPLDPRILEVGMTFHSVPVIYIPGLGAVGFSETWTLTSAGAQVLTNTARKLIAI